MLWSLEDLRKVEDRPVHSSTSLGLIRTASPSPALTSSQVQRVVVESIPRLIGTVTAVIVIAFSVVRDKSCAGSLQ